jgi:hypothetical protein
MKKLTLARILIVFSISIIPFVGCAPAKQTTRIAELNTDALETTLKRGISTASDVQAVLGMPNGTGSLLLPFEKQPRDVLFYEKIDIDPSTMKRVHGYIEIDVRQDVLLIFLKDNYFDGFLWFSDKVKPQ